MKINSRALLVLAVLLFTGHWTPWNPKSSRRNATWRGPSLTVSS